MKLLDSEKRDLINLIKNDKKLPEKYRYLLFQDAKKVEINWEDKNFGLYDPNLPFQVIEQIDEPRTENIKLIQSSFDFNTGRQIRGWSNKLIWGDNKQIIASLKNGSLMKSIEDEGGVKLIYIDPPFSVGQDYTIPVDIGSNEILNKEPSVIEMFAYRNTWNKQGNSFLQMLFERFELMKQLLDNNGVLVLRIDFHWGHYAKCILDEVFGIDNFRNEVIINRVKKNVKKDTRKLNLVSGVESLFFYSKSDTFEFKDTEYKLKSEKDGYWRACDSAGARTKVSPARELEGKTFYPPKNRHFTFSQDRMNEMYKNGKLRVNPKTNKIEYFVDPKKFADLDTNWTDIPGYSFKTGYPTENSTQLLERVIKACTNEKDLVCDFFNGSGTTAEVCEKINRKWIVSDIGKFSIHLTKKRLIETQRDQKKNQKNWRSFEILNIGRYQKEYFINNKNQENDKLREKEFIKIILDAYKANFVEGFKTIIGKKQDTYLSCGPVNSYVSRNHVEELIRECLKNKIINVDVLGFDYEMNLFPSIQEEAKQKGLRLNFKKIPLEIFDKNLVESGKVHFHEMPFIDCEIIKKKNKIKVKLTDFATFYDDQNNNLVDDLKNGMSKLLLKPNEIIKVSKNSKGEITEENITKNWYDWIDYWSVDFDYESKPEIISFKNEDNKIQEIWTGNYIFENEWQSFRSKNNKNIELETSEREVKTGSIKIGIKVVDIFGNDSLKIKEINI